MYGFLPYFLTKQVVEQPALILSALIYQLVLFWGVGLYNSLWTFLTTWLNLVMISEVATALGFIISAACDSMATASATSSLITLPSMLFAGLFVNDSTLFNFLSWIQYLSCIRYAFEGALISEFQPRDREYIYQDFLGFGTDLGFWKCQYCLLGLTIFARIISLIVLRINITKFQ